MDASCDPLTPVFSALSPKTSPSSHAGPLLPVPGRPVARARIASDPCDARAPHVLTRQDESTVAPHRRRTHTILGGDRDPVPQQEEAVSQLSAERDRRLPKTRPPYYVKSSATSSECDWDDDITDVPDVDVRESLDESGDGRVVHCADLRKSETTEEPPRPREEPFREERSDAADARQVGSASRVRVVRVPVYSVAGRRVSVRELLREKTRSMARSSDGARRLLRRVAGAGGDGRVGGATIAAILRSFNVASDADVVDAACRASNRVWRIDGVRVVDEGGVTRKLDRFISQCDDAVEGELDEPKKALAQGGQ